MSENIYDELYQLFEAIQENNKDRFNQFLKRSDFKQLAAYSIEPLTTPLAQQPNDEELLRLAYAGSNIFLWAVEMGRIDMVQDIIDKCPELLSQKSLTGNNVLHQLSETKITAETSKSDVFDIFKTIADRVPNLLNEKNKDGFTPVEWFALKGRTHFLDFFKGENAQLLPYKNSIPDWERLHQLANQGGPKALEAYILANHIQELDPQKMEKLSIEEVLTISEEQDFYEKLVEKFPVFKEQANRFGLSLDDRDEILEAIKFQTEIVKYESFQYNMNEVFKAHLSKDSLKLKNVTQALSDLVHDAIKLGKSFDTFRKELESSYHIVKEHGLKDKYFPGKYILKFLNFLFKNSKPQQKNLVDVFFEAMAKQKMLGFKTRYTQTLSLFGRKLGQEPIKKEEGIDKKVHLVPRG